ncbi:MAG: hypothetical protein GWP08_15240 [Nitrospiraceae bacterium]|nr:hypothetical protein [Nitrospiraceae bacterium]
MDELFEALCFVLEDALERQQNLLEICRAQGKAARAHDVEYMEAKTLTLVAVMREAVQAEKTRGDLIVRIAQTQGLAEPPENLTALTAIAPEEWRERLAYYQERLQETMEETRAEVRANAAVMRSVLRVVNRAVSVLEQCTALNAQEYDAGGLETAAVESAPKVLDQKG